MANKTIARNVRGRANEVAFGELGANDINLRHELDDLFLKRARSQFALDRGGGDTGPERLCQDKQITGTRVCIRGDVAKINNPCNGQTINRFGITNGMAADDRTTHLGSLGHAAAQNGRNYSWPDEIRRETNDVEPGQRAPAHCKDVGKRVGGRDLSIGKWVVHNGCEKINRLHQSAMSIQAINARIVERVRAHQHFAVQRNGKLRQNLPQGLLAQLGSSPRAGRERSQFTNLLTGHQIHPL